MVVTRDLAALEVRLDESDFGAGMGAIQEIKQDLLALIQIIKNTSTDLESTEASTQTDLATTEHLTGAKWIDGRPIYRKAVDVGAMPNNTTKNVAHGVVANQIISIKGFASGGGIVIPLPFVDSVSVNNNIYVHVGALNIVIDANADRSAFSGYVILEYVKAA